MGALQPAGSGRLTQEQLLAELERIGERLAGLEDDCPQPGGRLLDSLTQHLQDGFVLLDPDGVHLDVNPAFCEMVGIPREELVGGGLPHPYWPPEERVQIESVLRENLTGPNGVSEVSFMRRGGERFPAQLAPTLLRDAAGEVLCIFATVRDVGEERRTEAALQRSNRELHALSSCNQTLLRARDEETLLAQICRIVCEEAGYRMAWVGYAEQGGERRVRPVASAGDVEGYLASADVVWADVERGRGPAGLAIRSGQACVVQDFATDPRVVPWRESAAQHGLRSVIALPLHDGAGVVFGALLIYGEGSGAFTAAEVHLLEELAADLAFGVCVLREHAAHERTVAELRESEARYRDVVEHAPVGVFRSSLEGSFLYVNPACATTFGCATPAEMLAFVNGHGIAEAVYEDPEDRRRALADVHAADGAWITFKSRLHHRDGSVRTGLVYLSERRDPTSGDPGLLGFVQDVSAQEQASRALTRSSRLLGHGERLAHLGSWEWDIVSGVHAVSDGWQRLHGLVGTSLPDAVVTATCHEQDRPAVQAALTRAAAGDPYRVDHRIVRADSGEVRYLTTYGEPVFDEAGRLETLIGASLDVTDRVHADAALREREERLRQALGDTVAALGATVAMRDPYTASHERRVADLACRIAEQLGWDEPAREALRTAALVHDIGKIAVPAEILSKPGHLTESEFALIKGHPQAAHAILASISFAGEIAEIVLQHHERLDGSGYPRGLRGGEVLPEARVLAVADVVEAMISHRPYRPALPLQKAVAEISGGAGKLYDDDAVNACVRLIEDESFRLVDPA